MNRRHLVNSEMNLVEYKIFNQTMLKERDIIKKLGLIANMVHNGKKLNIISTEVRQRKGCTCSLCLFKIALEA